jgi:diaminopimelate decarboxylase
MDHFSYRNGVLHADELPVPKLVEEHGSPAYIYSARTLLEHYHRLASAFAQLQPTVCYSVKSCSNIHLLRRLVREGSGLDIVSGGELLRAQHAKVDSEKVVYAGVGKTDDEIRGALRAGIGLFNIESEAEFDNIARIAKEMRVQANAALRVNPDTYDPATHSKTTTGAKETKFGVDLDRARSFFETRGDNSWLRLTGLHIHLGSPIYDPETYVRALRLILHLRDELQANRHSIRILDIGGGFASSYETDQAPSFERYAKSIVPLLEPFCSEGGQVILEPGRSLVANAGILVGRVVYMKEGGSKKFAILDTGMHHLIRPTLYDAWHFIWPVVAQGKHVPRRREKEPDLRGLERIDVVGPGCETGDYFALGRNLPPLKRGDLVAVFGAGAYGINMASNYNTMVKPPEVLVDGNKQQLIRRRETVGDLLELELNPDPELLAEHSTLDPLRAARTRRIGRTS